MSDKRRNNSRKNCSLKRREILAASAVGGLALTGAYTVGAAETEDAQTSFVSDYDIVNCGNWQYQSPHCPESTDDGPNMDDVGTESSECWTETECRSGAEYTRECCFEPYFYHTDDDSHQGTGPGGSLLEGNLATTVTNLGSAIGGQWEETASGKWQTDFAVHSGYDVVVADGNSTADGDPAYVIEDFETTISVGTQPAYIHTYTNIHDPEDWVGATRDLDEFQSYDIADYVKETGTFAITFFTGRLPIIGDAIGTMDSVASYANTMSNMLTHDPTGGQSIDLEYDMELTATFSPWVRFRLDEMDPSQQVTIDISDSNRFGVDTNLSFSIQAPDENPLKLAEKSEVELEDRGVERYKIGDLREQKTEYRPEMTDSDIIHVKE